MRAGRTVGRWRRRPASTAQFLIGMPRCRWVRIELSTQGRGTIGAGLRSGQGRTMTTAWAGGVVGDLARAVLAPNPGPMTLEGTNTWVLRAPGAAEAVVVDPGPVDVEEHLAAVRAVSGQVALTLLTHHHRDHTGAVPSWQELTGSPVRGA